MNESRTCNDADTPLTQLGSGFGLVGDLHKLRDKYDANSAIGHRCSNIAEMLDNLPPGPDDRIEYLTSDATKELYERLAAGINQQAAELAKLLAAGG